MAIGFGLSFQLNGSNPAPSTQDHDDVPRGISGFNWDRLDKTKNEASAKNKKLHSKTVSKNKQKTGAHAQARLSQITQRNIRNNKTNFSSPLKSEIQKDQQKLQLLAKGFRDPALALKNNNFYRFYAKVMGKLEKYPHLNAKDNIRAKEILGKEAISQLDQTRQIQEALIVKGYGKSLGLYGADGKSGAFTKLTLHTYGLDHGIIGDKNIIKHLLNSARQEVGLSNAPVNLSPVTSPARETEPRQEFDPNNLENKKLLDEHQVAV